MIVVSNTSPITNLAAIEHFELFRRLFGQLHIADGVWTELGAGRQAWPGRREVEAAPWIERHLVQTEPLIRTLQRDLDRGEAETLVLALELNADLVLMDEREGRRAAQRLGFKVLGVVGMLIEAKRRTLIQNVRPLLDSLREDAGFYLSDAIYHRVLASVGEAEGS